MSESKKKYFLTLFIGFYFCSSALTNLISLPLVKEKVQIAELLFLPIFVLGYRYVLESFRRGELKKWFLCLPLLYISINLVSSVINGGLSSILESLGKVYLFLFYWITYCVFRDFSESELKAFLYKYVTFTSIVIVFTCFVGFLLWFCGVENQTGVYEFYPYLGYVFRTYGLTRTPGMLISVINICVPILILKAYESWKKTNVILILLLFLVALFTFSKSNIFLFSNTLLAILHFNNSKKPIIYYQFSFFLLLLTFIIFNAATHFLLVNKNVDDLGMYKVSYIFDRKVGEIGEYNIFETPYSALKRAAMSVFQKNPFLGLGTGNFDAALLQLKTEGLYPKDLPVYNPHCTFTGALAENGIFGFLAMTLFLFLLLKMAFINQQNSKLHFALFLCLFTAISEAFVADTMNFRHYWFLFAIVSAICTFNQRD